MCNCLCIEIPGTCFRITPGCTVKLGRFELSTWTVNHGWYSFGGNRNFCGWYLSDDLSGTIKPLQDTDLDDIYLIER